LIKISDLKPGMSGVGLIGKIVEVNEPIKVMTRHWSVVTVTNAIMEGESGSVKLVLWGKHSEGITVGKKIEIINGYTRDYRGELQFGIGRDGSVRILE
jgi:replication factor A1